MQPLDHLAVELHHALVGVLRQLEHAHDLARAFDLVRWRREGGIARLDLPRMDQRLAVEAHVAPCAHSCAKPAVSLMSL
jgi:hypothetical protein